MSDILRQWLVHTVFYVLGIVTGATMMIVVCEQPKMATRVVTVEQDGGQPQELPESHRPGSHNPALPLTQMQADEVRQLQRVKELRFSLEKLERTKAVHDAFLKYAENNQDDIRTRVTKLGEVGK